MHKIWEKQFDSPPCLWVITSSSKGSTTLLYTCICSDFGPNTLAMQEDLLEDWNQMIIEKHLSNWYVLLCWLLIPFTVKSFIPVSTTEYVFPDLKYKEIF